MVVGERFQGIKRMYDFVLFDKEAAGASAITAVSLTEKGQVAGTGIPENKIHVVHNFLDVRKWEALPGCPKERITGEKGCKQVLFLGKITPRKHVPTLIRAFTRLGRADCRLIVAGSAVSGKRQIDKECARSGMRNQITLLGFQNEKQKKMLILGSDLVVYAGSMEIFGLVAFESLLLGTPVIVADDSGCGELVSGHDLGRTVPPGDEIALTQAIAHELESDRTLRVARAGDWIRKNLDLPVAFGKFDRIYRNLLRQ